MASHNLPFKMHDANVVKISSTDAENIIVDRSPCVVHLKSAGAETRTLKLPTKEGVRVSLHMMTDGGDITVTVASAYNEGGSTTLVFSEVGQFAEFTSYVTSAGVYFWRLTSHHAIGNLTFSDDVLTFPSATTFTGAVTLTGGVASGLVTVPATAAAITTTTVLSALDSGGVFSVAKTSAYAITLPTPAQGVKFKFVVLDTGANIVTISDGSAHLLGIVSVNNVNIAMTGTTLSLASAGAVGDWVSFEGISATQYLVTGACINAADITIA
jgi:hypothetical protein